MEKYMKFTVIDNDPATINTECLVLFTDASESLALGLQSSKAHEFINAVLVKGDLKNKPGSTLMLPYAPECKAQRLLITAVGDKKVDRKNAQTVISGIVSALSDTGIKEAVICFDDLLKVAEPDMQWMTTQLAQSFVAAAYSFKRFKTKEQNSQPTGLNVISLNCNDKTISETVQKSAERGIGIANGINTARELGNLPGNVCTPQYLAEQAIKLADAHANLTTEILDEPAMKKLGMGAFLSVSKGSVNEGCTIIMNYQGGLEKQAPYVLIGKGITFDSGGICIKPGPSMDEMKFDMCGAASVMGAMTTITELKLPINVIGMIASAENMPAGNACKPGDIVTSMSGQTIEIINTDAEGRLVLCDALTYAEKFSPAAVIDIATLTGACIIALGHHISGMVSNDKTLAQKLVVAGEEVLDEVWQLPMSEDYDKQLESPCADLQNVGGRAAGTITAGCFLDKFAKNYPWAHIDIAGTAWKSGKKKAATGRPVAMLIQYLCTASKV